MPAQRLGREAARLLEEPVRAAQHEEGELRAEVHEDGPGIAKRAAWHPEDYRPNVEERRGCEMKPLADVDGAGEELARGDAVTCCGAPVALGKRRQIGYAQERTEVLQGGPGGAEMPSAIAPATRPYLGWSGVRVGGPGADEGCGLIRGDPRRGDGNGAVGEDAQVGRGLRQLDVRRGRRGPPCPTRRAWRPRCARSGRT